MSTPITISPQVARRIAVSKQRLAGTPPPASAENLLKLVRDLGCLQLDPTSVVARTNLLVPFSRVGVYDPALLDKLLWEDRTLFEYWAHAASIVLTEDYPIHSHMMESYRSGHSRWGTHTREWMSKNQELMDHILSALQERGPLSSKDFEEKAQVGWTSSGWTNDRNVGRMLDFLWVQGIVLVAGRKGGTRYWDLAERVLPEWTPREELSEHEVVRRSVQKAIRALGVAHQRDIKYHYTRGRYWGLPSALKDLAAEGTIREVTIDAEGKRWAGPWYVHADDLPLLDALSGGDSWQPRTALLSPFDNLICDRARTELLFDFEYRIEIYVPADKRKYGYYVLPILHGDRLIGRIDSAVDRKAHRLNVKAVYAEPGAPDDAATVSAVAGAVQELATFVGAGDIAYTGAVPDGWKNINPA
jgi:uncharacterized protein